MKKLLLITSVCVLFCTLSCGPVENIGSKGDKTIYILSKIKDVSNGKAIDFQEIKYLSTNPVVVSELGIFNWSSTETGLVIDSKFVFKDIVKTEDKITISAELLEKNGDVETYGLYTIALNKDGSMQKASFASQSVYIKDTEFQMEYNADGYLNKIITTGDVNFTINFTYEGENIKTTSYVDADNATFNCTFSGYDTENKGGIAHVFILDYDNMFDVFANLNLLGKPAKILPSKADCSDGVYKYTYEKDANGCISKLTSILEGDGDNSVYAYEYIEVIENKK